MKAEELKQELASSIHTLIESRVFDDLSTDFTTECIMEKVEAYASQLPTQEVGVSEGEIEDIAKEVANRYGGGLWGDYYRAAKVGIKDYLQSLPTPKREDAPISAIMNITECPVCDNVNIQEIAPNIDACIICESTWIQNSGQIINDNTKTE